MVVMRIKTIGMGRKTGAVRVAIRTMIEYFVKRRTVIAITAIIFAMMAAGALCIFGIVAVVVVAVWDVLVHTGLWVSVV